MSDETGVPASRGSNFPRIVAEACLVGVVGVVLALIGNAVSPRGLQLTTNYFPGDSNQTASSPIATTNIPSTSSNSVAFGTNAAPSALEAALRAEGLHLLDLAGAEKLFHDPRLQENLIMFVDARSDEDYSHGHIPGAFQFSPYHVEKYFAEIMPPCQVAQKIIVYCTGGECEDSHSAALDLRQAGISADKIYVFGGGITEWEAAKQPVEKGARNSGDVQNPAP